MSVCSLTTAYRVAIFEHLEPEICIRQPNTSVILGMRRNSLRILHQAAVLGSRSTQENQEIKGTQWMPWCQQAMKDVLSCDKPREAAKTL